MKNFELKLLLLVLLVSIIGITGWISNMDILTRFSNNYIPVAPLTALLFLFTSITYASLFVKNNKIIQLSAYPLLLLTVFLTIFNFIDIFFIHIFSFEHLFFSLLFGEEVYGEMTPLAGFLFLNSSLFFVLLKNNHQKLNQFFLKTIFYLIFIISVFFLIGYIENIPQFYSHKWIVISAPAAFSFFIISLIQLNIIEFNTWPFQYFSRIDFTGRIIKLLLPTLLLLLIIIEIIQVHFISHLEKIFSPFIILLGAISYIYFIIVKTSKTIGKEIEIANQNLIGSFFYFYKEKSRI